LRPNISHHKYCATAQPAEQEQGRTVKFIDAETVHRLLDWPYVIEALRTAHRGAAPQTGRVVLQEPRAQGQPNVFLAIAAWQAGAGLGVKLVCSFPGNIDNHGLRTVNALYAFFDPATGVPRAVIDGEALIFRKTAADSGLGSSLLARPDSETLLMVGAGAIAPYLIAAHRSVHPSLRRVLVWNRTRRRAEALVARLQAEGVNAQVAESLDAALEEADIVCSATMAETPLIKGARLRPGAHVDLVGSFTLAMREADDDALRRARIFCDTIDCLDRTGELATPLREGTITRDRIEGDLFDLCNGRIAPRRSDSEITLYKNASGGHIDLFVAASLINRIDIGKDTSDPA
jgi:ornithine cyclodeaminase/alanine dehydrogenase-like protein (mu-crystallin family)